MPCAVVGYCAGRTSQLLPVKQQSREAKRNLQQALRIRQAPRLPFREGSNCMHPCLKPILFCGIVIGPAIVVGISNFNAFPDSSLLATIMLVITVVVAGVFTWKSAQATAKISRYCIIADVIICAILCVNMGSHWILAREVSGAKQSTVERHAEEDREEGRKKAETERQLALKKADADLAKAEADRAAKNAGVIEAEERRLARLPRWLRTSQMPIKEETNN